MDDLEAITAAMAKKANVVHELATQLEELEEPEPADLYQLLDGLHIVEGWAQEAIRRVIHSVDPGPPVVIDDDTL